MKMSSIRAEPSLINKNKFWQISMNKMKKL